MINKFSNGLLFNEKDKNDDDNDLVISNEKRFICRTPKTKRNYITSLIENKFNYDYLCPNEKIQCKIYKECLVYKENELRNYARVIEATNNMFKFICQENEKLRETIRKKEEKIEEYTKELILNKIQINEIYQKLNNYEKANNNMKNNNNINFEILQKDNNINKNINLYIPSSRKNILEGNVGGEKINSFTLKKPFKINTQFTLGKEVKMEEIKNKENNKDKEFKKNEEEKEKIIKEEKKEEEKKEETNIIINLCAPEINEEKIKEKTEEISIKKESLNNPNNPLLSAVNIKTNIEFSSKLVNDRKDKNNNDINDESSSLNTMDNTNSIIKFGENSTSFNATHNIFSENNINSKANQF